MQSNLEGEAGVREGEVLAGKYRVERVLGIGGMGVVVAATHLQLETKVALKFLLPAMLRNQEVVGRFAREARAAVRIQSEHVARVSDVGTLENGAPYMVMEFLEGEDLAAWIQRNGALPVDQAVDFVIQACVGVASAHGIGIVHRDLKPANLFCLRGNDGQFVIKVLDFGISKVNNLAVSDGGGSMTHTSAVMGSPYYMSPEQMVSAKDVDARTDIWALGVVLYELLTAQTPFAGESFAEIAIKVATASFAPVRSYRPDAPPGLEAVLIKCLEKDKIRRYTNVAELALALADFGSRRSRPLIERVVGIIQASGLSSSVLALPPSPLVARSPTPATRLSPSDGADVQPPPNGYGTLGTMAPSANTTPDSVAGVPKRRIGTAQVAVAGLVVVIGIAAVVGWKVLPRSEPAAAAGDSLPHPAVASAPPQPATKALALEPEKAPDPLPTATPAAVHPAPAPAPAAPHATAPANHAAPGTASPPRPISATVLPAAPAPAAPVLSKPNCNPNFTWGPNGNKIFKPECF